jgi:single-stranded DNA-binding protein
MSSVNKVLLQGKIGFIEVTMTSFGKHKLKMSLATRDYHHEKAITTWHRVTMIGVRAAEWGSAFKKGDLVLVRGKLESRSYIDKKTKEEKFLTEVYALDIERGQSSGPDAGYNTTDNRTKAAEPDRPLWPEEST